MKKLDLAFLLVLILYVSCGHSAGYLKKGHRYCTEASPKRYTDLTLAKKVCDEGDCMGLLDYRCENKEFQLCPIGSAIETSNDGSCIHKIGHELYYGEM